MSSIERLSMSYCVGLPKGSGITRPGRQTARTPNRRRSSRAWAGSRRSTPRGSIAAVRRPANGDARTRR